MWFVSVSWKLPTWLIVCVRCVGRSLDTSPYPQWEYGWKLVMICRWHREAAVPCVGWRNVGRRPACRAYHEAEQVAGAVGSCLGPEPQANLVAGDVLTNGMDVLIPSESSAGITILPVPSVAVMRRRPSINCGTVHGSSASDHHRAPMPVFTSAVRG